MRIEISNHLGEKLLVADRRHIEFDVQILEDRFMAQIDLLDTLSGGLW